MNWKEYTQVFYEIEYKVIGEIQEGDKCIIDKGTVRKVLENEPGNWICPFNAIDGDVIILRR